MLRLHQSLSRFYFIDGKCMISCNSVPIFQCLPLTQPSILVISLLHPWLTFISLKISALEITPLWLTPCWCTSLQHSIICQYLNRKQQANKECDGIWYRWGQKSCWSSPSQFSFCSSASMFYSFQKEYPREAMRSRSSQPHPSSFWVDDIFGKHGNLKTECLVDSTGVEDFQ